MQALIMILTALLMLAGIVGTFLPFIPGCPLILGGALLYAWHTGFSQVSWGTLIFLLLLTLLSEVWEKGASFLGAKKYGASRWGILGVLLGVIGGLIVGGPLGLIFGPFLGAIILEILHGRAVEGAFQTGFGTIIGMLGGILGKLLIALIMVGLFLSQLTG
jgi:hypothetical protein